MPGKRTITLLAAGIAAGALGLTAAVRYDTPADVPANSATAAVDMFLKIEGVEGEATRRGHEGWIEIQSFGWGVSTAGGSAGRAARRAAASPTFQDISVTKHLDKATPLLAQACAEGRHIATAQIVLYRPGRSAPAGAIKLWDITIAAATATSDAAADRPVEDLSLSFGKIQWTYTEIDATGKARGTVTGGWDLAANRKL